MCNRRITIILLPILLFILSGCTNQRNDPETILRNAFCDSVIGENETYITGDLEYASRVTTGEFLSKIEHSLHTTGGTLFEAYVYDVEVEYFSSSEAIAVFEYGYQMFEIDPITDEKMYRGEQYSITARISFVFEDDVWKLQSHDNIHQIP